MVDPIPPAWLALFTVETIQEVIGLPILSDADAVWLADCRAWVAEYGVAAQVNNNLSDNRVLWAVKLHATRLFTRRSSPTGGSTQFDTGAAGALTSQDSDLVLAYRSNMPRIG